MRRDGARRWTWVAVGTLALGLAGIAVYAHRPGGWLAPARPGPTTPATPSAISPAAHTFVGAARCATCHPREAEAYRDSHHARAMQPAAEGAVLGDFDGARFTHRGVTTSFLRRDGKHFVRTEGADGTTGEFEIAYTFGFRPLQQYLVPFAGGRLQALGIAWDTRSRAQGGQRWFHLYPDETPRPPDALH